MAFHPDTQRALDEEARASEATRKEVLATFEGFEGVGAALTLIAGAYNDLWSDWAAKPGQLEALRAARQSGYGLLTLPGTKQRKRAKDVVVGPLLRALATVEDLIEFFEECGGAE